MIEDLHIISGTPEKVAKKAEAYLASHPNAKILGTAACYKPGELIEKPAPVEAAPAKPATKKAANAPADEAKESQDSKATQDAPEPDAAATLQSVEYGPATLIVTLTLGKEF